MPAPAHDTMPHEEAQAAPANERPDQRTGQGGLMAGREDLTAIEIKVADHPGALPQVCGLLARRVFQAEAVLSLPGKGGRSVWLLVPDDARLEQLTRQMSKLGDVHGVVRHDGLGPFGSLVG